MPKILPLEVAPVRNSPLASVHVKRVDIIEIIAVEVTTTLHDDFAIQTRDGKVAAGAGHITMHIHLLPLDSIAFGQRFALELELADAHGVVGPFLAVDLGNTSEAVEHAFH
jgi:hypothetical protein